MTIEYRGITHCDIVASGACHGLLAVAGDSLSLPGVMHLALRGRGWATGTRGSPDHGSLLDVCPACLPAAVQRGVTLAPPEREGNMPTERPEEPT